MSLSSGRLEISWSRVGMAVLLLALMTGLMRSGAVTSGVLALVVGAAWSCSIQFTRLGRVASFLSAVGLLGAVILGRLMTIRASSPSMSSSRVFELIDGVNSPGEGAIVVGAAVLMACIALSVGHFVLVPSRAQEAVSTSQELETDAAQSNGSKVSPGG